MTFAPVRKAYLFAGLGLALGLAFALLLMKLPLPYFFLVAGGVLFLIFVYNHIEIGLGILIASMLFEKPILPGQIEISLTRILSLPVLAVAFLKILLDGRKFSLHWQKDGAVVLLLFCCLLSMIVARDFSAAFISLVTLVQLIFLYFVFKTIIDSQEMLEKTLVVAVIACVGLGIFTLVTIIEDPSSLVYSAKMTWSERVTGTSDDPNRFAMGLVWLLPVGMYLSLTRHKLYLLSVLLTIFLIISTFSRGGYIALVLCLVLSLVQIAKYTRKGLLYSCLVVLLLSSTFVVLNQGNKIVDRVETFQNYRDGSIGTRREIMDVAIDMGIHNPIIGVGLDNFSSNSHLYGNRQHYHREAHNGYLEIFATLGFPGIALVLAMIYWSFADIKAFRNQAHLSGKTKAVLLAGFIKIALIGFLVAAAFLSLFSQKLFWVLLAFSSVLHKLAIEAETSRWVGKGREEAVERQHSVRPVEVAA